MVVSKELSRALYIYVVRADLVIDSFDWTNVSFESNRRLQTRLGKQCFSSD